MALLPRALLLLLLAAPMGAAAQTATPEAKQEELQKLERDIAAQKERRAAIDRQQKELEAEIEALRDQLVLAGRSATDNETALSSLEIALGDLERDSAAKRKALLRRQGELIELAAAAQRLSLHPPDSMILLPQPPNDTIRTAIALRGTMPALSARMAILREELDEVRRVEQEVRRQRDRVDASIKGLAKERGQIATLLKRKQDLEKNLSAEEKRAEQRLGSLTESAKDLRDLIDKLIADRIAEEKKRQEEAARRAALRQPAVAAPRDLGEAVIARDGSRTMPASGRITGSFGQADSVGSTARGMSIATRSDATIVSPASGRILFAGPFRGYGLILIVEHGDGYHSLLAGLGRIDTAVGRAVRTGEPVGSMPASGQEGSLYYELRRNGQPTDPRPWIAAQRAR